jgi:hypothetical protein
MAYNAAVDRVVLYGGWSYDQKLPIDDTVWLYDFEANTWSPAPAEIERSSTGGLQARYDSQRQMMVAYGPRKHAMTYDCHGETLVIYGGISTPPQPSGEPSFLKQLTLIRL